MWGLEDDFAFEAAYGGGSDQTDVVLDSSSIAAFCEKVALRKVSRAELALHKSADDCWVALHGTVYDLTKFAKSHVGGSDSITKLAGKDGTDAFARKHGANVLNSLTGDCIIGEFSSDDAASTQGGYMIVDDIIKSIDSGDPGASNVVQSIPWVADVAEGNSHASAKRPRTDVSSESVETHPPRAIVIGGGLAGMSAANTIIEYGGKVVLVEKAAFCGGNSTKATSGINGACTPAQKSQAIVDSSDIFEADTLVGGARNPQIAKVLCQNSGEAIQWLVDNFSLDLSQVSQLGGHSRPRTHRGKERFPGMMITYALIQAVERYAETGDMAQIVTKARAARLLMDSDGTCVGCAYEQAGVEHELRGPVILATGGFAADFGEQSLLAQYRPDLLHLPTTNSEQSTGDGIKMGENIGAKTIDLEWVQVHPTGLVDIGNPDSKVKFLAAEALRGAGGLIIDGDGRRILNELGRRDDTTGQMWKHKPPFRLILNRAASQEVFWHCKHYASRNVMKYYETGKEFAEDIGVPLFVLEQTHEEHFQAARKQQEDPEGGPWPAYPNGRSWDEPSGSVGTGKKFFRNVICGADFSSEPFYVAVVTPVLHYCMGGLEADATAAVLGRSGDAIRGLWAAGEVVGGVHGNNRLGGNSLLDCVVFGRISGQECARYMLGSTATSRSIAKGSQEKALLLDSDANLAQSLTLEDVAKHRSEEDCWIVVSGRVLNVTSFLKEHPGGALPILACAGRDATAEFDAVHPPDMISKYASGFVVGYVRDKDDATLPCRAEPAMNNVSSAPAFVAKLSELPSNVYCPCCRRAVADSHRDENHIRAKCLECGIEFTIERLHK